MDMKQELERSIKKSEELLERTLEWKKAQGIPRQAYETQARIDEAEHGDEY